jgi:hypothetical protein
VCDVTALAVASFAMDAGSKVAGASAQNKASKENKRNALSNLRLQNADISARVNQETEASLDLAHNIYQQGDALSSTAATSAAESGVAGNSVDALLRSVLMEEGTAVTDVNKNLANTLAQSERQRRGATAEAQSRIAGVPGANPLATGLGVAGAGITLATQLKRYSLTGQI